MKTTLSRRQVERFRKCGAVDLGEGWSARRGLKSQGSESAALKRGESLYFAESLFSAFNFAKTQKAVAQ